MTEQDHSTEELPFAGLLVLELASVLAGPSVGQFFAELGARVIKIENPATRGDVTRKWKLQTEEPGTDRPAYFTSVNWGKESVALDISRQEGLALLHSLVTLSDFVIASYKPGDAKKLGVSYQQLSAINPKLIYGEITGYGNHLNRAGYDAVLQAETGFMYLNGQPDGAPTKMPVALIDILASHQLKEGILAALYQREKTGKGKHIEVSLFGAAVCSLANQATNYLVAGSNPQRLGSEHPNIMPYGTLYQTKDNQLLTLAIGDDRQFASLCRELGMPQTATDQQFATNQARVKNRALLQPILAEAISERELTPLLQNLIAAHVPAGAVNDVATVFANPESKRFLLTSANPDQFSRRGLRTVAFGTDGRQGPSELTPPPGFGAHTGQVLSQLLCLTNEAITQLRHQGVVA